jgi:chromosome partitioning protein
MPVVTIAAAKGGVGKTTLAYELAASLDGVLVDLDWDLGGATRMWGYDPRSRQRAPLLDALEAGPNGKPPTPRTRPNQPALVPSHRDLAASSIDETLVADCLASWADAWNDRTVVVDTHPGANALTDGAVQVADLVVVPVVLASREMDALEGMLDDFSEYHLLLAPNMVPRIPPRRLFERLKELVDGQPVAPPVSEHRWLRRRLRRAALTLQPNPGVQVERAAEEFRAVARTVEREL